MTRPEETTRFGSFRPILGGAVLLFVGVLAMAGTKSYHDLEAARQRRHLLETQIESTEGEITRLRGRIERLRSDPGALERRAREDLGMVRQGDVVIELPQDPGPPAPGPALPTPALPSVARPTTVPAAAAPAPASPGTTAPAAVHTTAPPGRP